MAAEKSFEHLVPKNNTVFAYVVEGSVDIAGRQILQAQCAVLGEGDIAKVTSLNDSRFLFVSGTLLGEPVAWGGPIVMNTEEELEEAFKELEFRNLHQAKKGFWTLKKREV